jgi:hypothetical protein
MFSALKKSSVIHLSLLAFACWASIPASSAELKNWRDIHSSSSQPSKFIHLNFTSDNGSKVNLIVFNYESSYKLLPVINTPGCPTADAAKKYCALAGVNGGYFNLSNGESTSYVVANGKSLCEPRNNKALVDNPNLKPYLSTIFNRSELRVLRKKDKTVLRVMKHEDPIPDGYTLTDSLQAGPQLLPTLTAKEEAFVRLNKDGSEFDSIGVNKRAARTAIGITDDGYAMLVAVAGSKQDEFSSGITVSELAGLLKGLGCTQALNLDGGTSTTMVLSKESNPSTYDLLCGRTPQTRVKSALLIVRSQSPPSRGTKSGTGQP